MSKTKITDLISEYAARLPLIAEKQEQIYQKGYKDAGENKLSSTLDGNVTELTEKDLRGLTGLRDYALYKQPSLTQITIPNSVTNLGTYALASCAKLTNVTFGNGISIIPQRCCSDSRIRHVYIPKGMTKIDTYAFYSSRIRLLRLPDSMIEIAGYAFYTGTPVYLIIPKSVTTIANYAFYGSSNLKIIDLTDYGADAPFPSLGGSSIFTFNSSGAEIRVPVGRKAELSAMTNWSKYEQYMIETDEPFIEEITYIQKDDGTYWVDSVHTFSSPELVIPDTHNGFPVTNTGYEAFKNSSWIQKVIVGSNVKTIGYCCFDNCTELETVVLPEGVTTLDQRCFYGCKKLTNIDIPDSITDIKTTVFCNCDLRTFIYPPKVKAVHNNMFQNNVNLKYVIFNSVINTVWGYAFADCASLEYIDMTAYGENGAFPVLKSVDAFRNCGTLATAGTFEIRVPIGRKATLAAMTNWSEYADNIVEVSS